MSGNDVENHLDDFFSDEGPSFIDSDDGDNKNGTDGTDQKQSHSENKKTPVEKNPDMSGEDADNHPVKELNAIVLEMDWEITENIMGRFVAEVDRLKKVHKKNNLISKLLEILYATGKYIKSKKVDAHPDSIKLLQSSYNSVEKILTTPKLTPAEKKSLVTTEIKGFKNLQGLIRPGAGRKAAAKVTKAKAAAKPVASTDLSGLATKEDLLAAMKDMKKWIQKELQKLK